MALRAHFDGKKIVLDKLFELEPDAELIVTVLPNPQEAAEREEWFALAAQMLERAYGGDEPEYDISSIKEFNSDYAGPDYAGR